MKKKLSLILSLLICFSVVPACAEPAETEPYEMLNETVELDTDFENDLMGTIYLDVNGNVERIIYGQLIDETEGFYGSIYYRGDDYMPVRTITYHPSGETDEEPEEDPDAWKYELTDYVIPAEETVIDDEEFKDCYQLRSITLHDGITSIGNHAFENCALSYISIPGSVLSIGDGAFQGCKNLRSVSIGYGVKNIGNGAFLNTGLSSVSIPASVTSLGYSAFFGCSSLSSVSLPESITHIQSRTFYKCSSLTSINIPATVTVIDKLAFSGCSSLKTVSIPNSLISIEDNAFSSCSGLIDFYIPANVEKMGNEAFRNCNNLKTFVFNSGSSLNSLGRNVFAGCNKLEEIDWRGEKLTQINDFYNLSEIRMIRAGT